MKSVKKCQGKEGGGKGLIPFPWFSFPFRMEKKVSFPFFGRNGKFTSEEKGEKERRKRRNVHFLPLFSLFLPDFCRKEKEKGKKGNIKKSCRKGKNEEKREVFIPTFACAFFCARKHTLRFAFGGRF